MVIEDEASIASAVAARLRSEGFRVEIAADGPSGVDLCERAPARPGRPRPHAPRPRRPGGVPPGPAGPARAGAHADGPGLRDRHARRPGRRRRRLHDQAVQPPGAGGPGPRHPAPGASGRSVYPGTHRPRRRRRDRPRHPPGARGGEEVHLTPTEFDLLALAGARTGARCTPASSCWPRCGATATARAPAPSTPTSGPCAASSAPTSSAPCTAWATRLEDRAVSR